MKNQDKILLSLITASVSALATAPYILEKDGSRNVESNEVDEIKSIDINVSKEVSVLTEEEIQAKQEIKSYVEAVLTKKSPIVNIGKNIDVVTENYANIKKEVFVELGAGVAYDKNNGDDSEQVSGAGKYTGKTTVDKTPQLTFCHSACHSNCHGARGWR